MPACATPGRSRKNCWGKILRGVSAQKYADTVLDAAHTIGVSPTAISHKVIDMTTAKLKAFQERPLKAFTPFALFLDTIRRGGEALVVALGMDVSREKMALGFWQGSSENHQICEALFRDLEQRGLALARRILFVADGGSGLIKSPPGPVRQEAGASALCHLEEPEPPAAPGSPTTPEAHRRLMTALEQTSYADARRMLRELEAWLRTKNESAAASLVEALEELLTLHRVRVPPLLRKTLLSPNPIESMYSLVRHSERNIKRTRGSRMLQRWLGTVLLACEGRFRRVKGYAEIAPVLARIEAEQQPASTKKAA